jgi:hypothetical protein
VWFTRRTRSPTPAHVTAVSARYVWRGQGHPHTLRLDLEGPDSEGHSKYVISVEDDRRVKYWSAIFAAAVVSRAFPSYTRSILTEIYLCHSCSCHEIEDGNARAGLRHRGGERGPGGVGDVAAQQRSAGAVGGQGRLPAAVG